MNARTRSRVTLPRLLLTLVAAAGLGACDDDALEDSEAADATVSAEVDASFDPEAE